MTNVEEIFNLLETSYAIQQQSKAMTMYDLYYGKHKIQSKPDKVVGDEAFRTSKVMLNYYKLAVKFFVYLILSQPVKFMDHTMDALRYAVYTHMHHAGTKIFDKQEWGVF